MAVKRGTHTEPRRQRSRRGARAGVVAVGVLAASLLAGATAAQADTVGVTLCVKVNQCSVAMPFGVRWQ